MKVWMTALLLALAWTGPSEGRELDGETMEPDRFRLENGLTVIVRPIEGAREVALVVLYKLGGDHDPQGQSGLAHLIEHVYVTAAAGKERARTAEEFSRRYRSGCNAQTGDRYTVIATVFPKGDLREELREAAARMGDLRVTAADLDRERPRILDEVANMFGRFPALGALNNARELIRPTPRGGRKGGLLENVQMITVEDVRVHWDRYYKPQNAILVLAGAFDPGEVRQAVTERFAKLVPGDQVPAPGEPGKPKFGAVRELAVNPPQPQVQPEACLAYAAPEPGSDLYAPFLVLVTRLWAGAPKLGGGPGQSPIYFPLLEDPAVLGVTTAAKRGELAPQAFARLESFVAEALEPELRKDELVSARQTFGLFLGTSELPDLALRANPYGVALSLARREQLGIDPAKLKWALEAVTDQDLRHAATEIFAPGRHSGALITLED